MSQRRKSEERQRKNVIYPKHSMPWQFQLPSSQRYCRIQPKSLYNSFPLHGSLIFLQVWRKLNRIQINNHEIRYKGNLEENKEQRTNCYYYCYCYLREREFTRSQTLLKPWLAPFSRIPRGTVVIGLAARARARPREVGAPCNSF